jgi:hypothetical protein
MDYRKYRANRPKTSTKPKISQISHKSQFETIRIVRQTIDEEEESIVRYQVIGR